MKKLVAPFAVLLLLSFGLTAEKLTDEEREKAVGKLTSTHEHMINTLEGLSEEQLDYKTTPESWSIAECVEHLTISEHAFAELLKTTLATPPDEAMRAAATMEDDQVYAMISSREKKVKTSEAFEPTGKFGGYQLTLDALTAKRTEHIEYLKTTEDDFRNHFNEMPFGTLDAYQIVIFMAGHTERHVMQMEEILEDEDFPEE
ncbi:MAG: DinB family protein [Flavobacteriaceae bacterium]